MTHKNLTPGLQYIPNYISTTQESALLQTIDSQPWILDLKRRTQHYGYKYDYTKRTITQDLYLGPLPNWLQFHDFTPAPDQVIINEYLPGQGISAHTDCVPCFTDIIRSISLGSPCIMDFTKGAEKIQILLEPRSLLIVSGEARYKWMHGIAARKSDVYEGQRIGRGRRVSITFRGVITV